MAEGGSQDVGTMSFTELLNKLMAMTHPVPNDKRQDQYCSYISSFVSEFGIEHCQVVGSTKEGTRLRSEQDEGDYDYILSGNFIVPTDCLVYREDLPCFVHIKGSFMGQEFCDQLIDGVYLPTWLLKNVSILAFPHLKGIFDIVSRSTTSHGRNTPHLAINTSMKPGYSLVNYADWDCKDLSVKRNARSASERALYQQFEERRKSSKVLQEDGNNILASFAAVIDFIENMKNNDTSTGLVYQQFGPILSALAGKTSGTSKKRPTDEHSNDDKEQIVDSTCHLQENEIATSSRGKKARMHTSDKDCMTQEDIQKCCDAKTDNMDVSTPAEETFGKNGISTPEENTVSGITEKESVDSKSEEKKDTEVYATYRSKSKKDFILALRLSEPPKFIQEWMQRVLGGHWPNPEIVEDISKSQFFVVAKPAVKDEKPDIDFCLSCNLAEIILAREMPPGHKKCLLMIKAFQRSVLEEYSEVVTTFHWKTAIYRMLESTDPATYSENSGDVLDVLRKLLDYMRDRLHEGCLIHYFFPSNLFAGLERDIRVAIVEKIEKIHLDPIFYLRSFFCLEKERAHARRVVKIPVSTLDEVKNQVEHRRDERSVDAFVNVLEGFAKPASTDSIEKPKVPIPNLILQIAETALTDEENRRKDKEENGPTTPPTVSKDHLMESVKGLFSTLGADRSTRRQAEKEAKKAALAYFSAGKK
ncbi:uncharacterized protein LOC132543950 [Ylistrum balloti]|uniref:uncharacterized protein LOC132543950 n=1 Tax=Ylistrum balloti TaxID=509963 RepID=UPI002905E11E|nr:uncharacterized protein LOC132543950 [Ylistrum balloti]